RMGEKPAGAAPAARTAAEAGSRPTVGRPLSPHEPGRAVARAEASLYSGVLRIREEHGLERLGIAFYDAETTLQWSYNADDWFHAASTMKLAVLLGVFRQVHRGELSTGEAVHVRNKFTSIVDRQPFALDLSR